MLLSGVLRQRWPAGAGVAVLLVCALPLTGTVSGPSSSPTTRTGRLSRWNRQTRSWSSAGPSAGSRPKTVSCHSGDADRFMAGVDLLTAGKAPLIILTRGQWPWSNPYRPREILASRARMMGIHERRSS